MQEYYLTQIKNNKLFYKVNETDIKLHVNKESFFFREKGELIFKEGEAAEEVFLLLKGEVQIYKERIIGRSKKAVVNSNDFFGEEEYISGEIRRYSALAQEDSLMVRLNRDTVTALITLSPEFSANLNRNAADTSAGDIFGDNDAESDTTGFTAEDGSADVKPEIPLEEPGQPEMASDESEEQAGTKINGRSSADESSESDKYFTPIRDDQSSRISFDEDISFSLSETAEPSAAADNGNPASRIPETPAPHSHQDAGLDSSQLRLIIEAAKLVNSTIKIDDVLEAILNAAKNLTGAERGTFYLLDREKNELWSKIMDARGIQEIRLKMGEGIAGWVAQNCETVNISDVAGDARFNGKFDRASGFETRNMLCFPVKNKTGEVAGVLQLLNSSRGEFTSTDEEFLSMLSIHAAMALENAELVERLLQSERISSLGKMANFLIQDIKKPILVSRRFAEHLKTKQLSPEIAQVVDMLLDQLGQVTDIVQTTSSYSEGKTVLRSVSCGLNETLDEILDKLEPNIRARNCSIVRQYGPAVNVKLDRKEFYLCCMHIIRNACDAMPDGGTVMVITDVLQDKVKIVFKDNGLGIPDSIREKIFEPFMSHGKKDGTGLGLSVTKKVVEDHGGTIDVESDLGEGSTFIITMPLSVQL